MRCVVGVSVLVVVRVVVVVVVKELLFQLCGLASIPCVCVKRVSTVTSEKVHFSKHFITLQQVNLFLLTGELAWVTVEPLYNGHLGTMFIQGVPEL